MKRALVIFVAALIVLFACPSTDSVAGPPSYSDPVAGSKPGNDNDWPSGVDSSDDDDGDADGVAGYKTKRGFGDSNSTIEFEGQLEYLKLWWNLIFWFR